MARDRKVSYLYEQLFEQKLFSEMIFPKKAAYDYRVLKGKKNEGIYPLPPWIF